MCTSPFLNTGVTMALDQSDGMVPLSRVWLNRAVMTLANSFSTRFGSRSGPDALWGGSVERSLATPSLLTKQNKKVIN